MSTPLTQDLLNHLDLHRASLRDAFAQVPVERRGERPAPDRWSAAEVLEHLSIVDARIAALFVKHATEARAAGRVRGPGTERTVPVLDTARLLDRTNRLTASEASVPQGGMDAETAIARLETGRVSFRQAIEAAEDLALEDMTADHARLGPLNMYQWVLFLGAHEGRHAAQIREIADALKRD